ncbi:kinase-like domain-containing protein [Cyathus striatus]|nr:kinase-like domain-containing protein [Cyathus striatus]
MIESCPLIWPDFLITPLLPIGGAYQERKFCGNGDVVNNTDTLGRAVDAYIHHALVDSHSTFLLADIQGMISPSGQLTLFDPQAHSPSCNASEEPLGYWDKGRTQIDKFYREHSCNTICRSLHLHDEPKLTESQQRDVERHCPWEM